MLTNDGSKTEITSGLTKANQTTAETTIFNPVEDAYISQTTSDNYGSQSELMVKMAYMEEHGATRITYLKFDMSSENLGSADIYKAKLRLYCTLNNVSAPTLDVYDVTDDTWTEF
jgi:hypothetical protein